MTTRVHDGKKKQNHGGRTLGKPLTSSGGCVSPGWAIARSSVVAELIWAVCKICLTNGPLRPRLLVLWHPVGDPVGPKTNKDHHLNETEMKPMSAPLTCTLLICKLCL